MMRIPVLAALPSRFKNRRGLQSLSPHAPRLTLSFGVLAVVLALGGIARAEAASLLDLVGSDVGLCAELPQLRQTVPALIKSPLAERFRQSRFRDELRESRPYRNFVNARAAIEAITGKPFGTWSRELFGRSVVLAVYPAKQGEPKGVLLTRASNRAALEGALEAWHRAEACEVVEHSHDGTAYFERRRTMPKGTQKPADYYIVLGDVLAISDSQAMIEAVAELSAGSAHRRRLTDLPLFQSVKRDVPASAAAWVYLNPQVWTDVGKEMPEHDPFRAVWTRCRAVAAWAEFSEGATFDLALHLDTDGIAGWPAAVAAAQGAPRLLSYVPSNAVAVLAGRWSLSGVDDFLEPHMSQHERQEWDSGRRVLRGLLGGHDLFDDVLPVLGPDWAGYIVGRSDAPAGVPPFHGLLAVALGGADEPGPSEGAAQSSLEAGVKNGLISGINLMAAVHNHQNAESTARVVWREEDTGFLCFIADFGAVEPAFAVSGEHLVVSSSVQAIEDFREAFGHGEPLPAGDRAEAARAWWDGRVPEGINQVLLVNLRRLRETLGASSGWPGQATEAARERLWEALTLADMGYVGGAVDTDRVRISLGVRLFEDREPITGTP